MTTANRTGRPDRGHATGQKEPSNMNAKQVSIQGYYPAGLKKSMTAFNTELSEIGTERARLSADAETLKKNAAAGALKKPERLAADIAELQGRRVALDCRELTLIGTKQAFQSLVTEARKVERERVTQLATEREAELNKGLDAMGSDSKFRQGLIVGDSKLIAFKGAMQDLCQFQRVVVAEDEERGAFLSARLAGSVPKIED